jgi:hypothetical protein
MTYPSGMRAYQLISLAARTSGASGRNSGDSVFRNGTSSRATVELIRPALLERGAYAAALVAILVRRPVIRFHTSWCIRAGYRWRSVTGRRLPTDRMARGPAANFRRGTFTV